MITSILVAFGGLGLFLIGITMLTEGLRALAGDRMRKVLRRSTSTPLRGVVAGVGVTAALQSSSATTVAVVGFVGAGLMTFRDSLGIIFGANIGTTLTGWIIAVIGVKLALGTLMAPVVLAGALAMRFGRGHWAEAGRTAAGFGLLFLGIAALQEGLAGLGTLLSPDRFPGDNLIGRLELLAIGVAVTLVTQSSSAGVAMAITALGAGAITFPQAAALVIGMDVGTTATAALAAAGGSTATRRTGAAHVTFNLLTGALAFVLLWPAGWAFERATIAPEFALTLFHTGFNTLGTVLMLLVVGAFARLVVALVPDRGPGLTGRLDTAVQGDAAASLDAAHASLRGIAEALFARLHAMLTGGTPRGSGAGPKTGQDTGPFAEGSIPGLDEIDRAIDETLHFVERIPTPGAAGDRILTGQLAALHGLDHLARLSARCRQIDRASTLVREPLLAEGARTLADVLPAGKAPWSETRDRTAEVWRFLHDDREGARAGFIAAAAEGRLSAHALTARLDAARWLYRSGYHVWRIAHHLSLSEQTRP